MIFSLFWKGAFIRRGAFIRGGAFILKSEILGGRLFEVGRLFEEIRYLSTSNQCFKMNLSFSFILQHRETGEFRYQYASNDNRLLNSPLLIRNQHELIKLLHFLALQDFPSQLKDQCPKDRWYGNIGLRPDLNQSSDILQHSQIILTGDR